jgi:hypothetical protein
MSNRERWRGEGPARLEGGRDFFGGPGGWVKGDVADGGGGGVELGDLGAVDDGGAGGAGLGGARGDVGTDNGRGGGEEGFAAHRRGDLIHAKMQRRKDARHRVALRPGDFALESSGLGEPPDLRLTVETFWV